jgi:hypothetical protein
MNVCIYIYHNSTEDSESFNEECETTFPQFFDERLKIRIVTLCGGEPISRQTHPSWSPGPPFRRRIGYMFVERILNYTRPQFQLLLSR